MLDNTILTVSVPATSANIGVGYDTLGLAFNLRAKITFRESPTLIIDGCPEQFRNDDNLVWTSYIRACEKLGEEPTPKHITIRRTRLKLYLRYCRYCGRDDRVSQRLGP